MRKEAAAEAIKVNLDCGDEAQGELMMLITRNRLDCSFCL
jgi:hypothetical protein